MYVQDEDMDDYDGGLHEGDIALTSEDIAMMNGLDTVSSYTCTPSRIKKSVHIYSHKPRSCKRPIPGSNPD